MNMIEKVANAVAPELNKREMVLTDPIRLNKMMAKRVARAAINALREPSDAMLTAGVVHDDATYSTWIAMIDEALRNG